MLSTEKGRVRRLRKYNIFDTRISRKFYCKPTFWISFLIIFNCIYKSFIHIIDAPESIAYVSDIAWIVLMVMLFKDERRSNIIIEGFKWIKVITALLFIETLIGFLIHLYNPFVFLWGFRTFFRFIIFLMACIRFAKVETIKKMVRTLEIFLYVNFVACVFEYLLGYGLDSVSGLYSTGKTARGGTAGLNVLMCIVCAYAVIRYIYKEISLLKMSIPIFLCLFMAAISEMKAFYFEFILIAFWCVMLTRFTTKKILLVVTAVALVAIGFALYSRYFGHKNTIYSMAAMLSYAGADGSTYGQHLLNRTTAIPFMLNIFLTDPFKKMFGLGLGYADNVSTDFLSSGFNKQYTVLGYHYFFSSLEITNIGIVGLGLYYAVVVFIFVFSRKEKNNIPTRYQKYFVLTEVVCILVVFLTFYNQSLILDTAAYNIYLLMSIPFVIKRDWNMGYKLSS